MESLEPSHIAIYSSFLKPEVLELLRSFNLREVWFCEKEIPSFLQFLAGHSDWGVEEREFGGDGANPGEMSW